MKTKDKISLFIIVSFIGLLCLSIGLGFKYEESTGWLVMGAGSLIWIPISFIVINNIKGTEKNE